MFIDANASAGAGWLCILTGSAGRSRRGGLALHYPRPPRFTSAGHTP